MLDRYSIPKDRWEQWTSDQQNDWKSLYCPTYEYPKTYFFHAALQVPEVLREELQLGASYTPVLHRACVWKKKSLILAGWPVIVETGFSRDGGNRSVKVKQAVDGVGGDIKEEEEEEEKTKDEPVHGVVFDVVNRVEEGLVRRWVGNTIYKPEKVEVSVIDKLYDGPRDKEVNAFVWNGAHAHRLREGSFNVEAYRKKRLRRNQGN